MEWGGELGGGERGVSKERTFKKMKGHSVLVLESKTKNFSIPETNIILYVDDTSIKRNKKPQ